MYLQLRSFCIPKGYDTNAEGSCVAPIEADIKTGCWGWYLQVLDDCVSVFGSLCLAAQVSGQCLWIVSMMLTRNRWSIQFYSPFLRTRS